LEENTLRGKLEKLYALIETEMDFIKLDRRIRSRVKQAIDRNQREFYLNEQMRAIQKELGEDEDDFRSLEAKIDSVGLSKEALVKAKSELKKLKKMPQQSPEATVIRNYLDAMLDLPWGARSELNSDIGAAENILDEEHYALEKVKERILEFLAVQRRVGAAKGSILCFMGPPGVGKTSLGKAIAKATGRVFEKISLGGVHDEAEIRGHRRTYIGSQCGKILSAMKKAGVNNPLVMLDEIDKMGMDSYHGDPASALLEVLDPEQNFAFNDHYLDLDYDLSKVMFITTANTYNIPKPLLDRMEIIELSGYTEEEKVEIARRHIMPKEFAKNGLSKDEFSLADDAIKDMIRYYTRESGVRGLERMIDKVMRKALRKLSGGSESDLFKLDGKNAAPAKPAAIRITGRTLAEFAGVRKFDHTKAEKQDAVGMVTGLAWTEVGGEILTIESAVMAGKGLASLTGKLGDVMKESIETAKSFVRSRSNEFGINPKIWSRVDIHIHVPEGATPKDGPSAGVAMMTSIVSTLTDIPVKKDVAMTGEITLRGRVLPIGGLKEKLLAALRSGVKTVLIPFENVKDLEEIPQMVKDGLRIVPVKTADEVLRLALAGPLSPITAKGNFFEDILTQPLAPEPAMVQ
jgi:ATP-dependent Lon protease